jgi:hypothetical protein
MEGLLEWAADFEDGRGRIVRQDHLWNGLFVSTVWTGLANYRGSPEIFETMVFHDVFDIPEIARVHYTDLRRAEVGHILIRARAASLGYTLRLFWNLIWKEGE